ncbi:MAG TPA: matrixin family metalloprotease [Thermoanaerobaculia bacterium]|nr:matrixin family metalloprotease [Thermoanaerobaculia bacterium]
MRLGPGSHGGDAPEVAIIAFDGEDVTCGWRPPQPRPGAFTFADSDRWSRTATDGSGLNRGDPTTLTWGIVPDGTPIPGFIGEPSAPSDLVAFLDAIRGAGPGGSDLTQRPWFPVFQSVFERWSALTGMTYVYEPADDGVSFSNVGASPGVLGVRADVRIGGHFIDGESGSNVLAYNFFPDNGEMVIDTSNTIFFADTSSDSLRLRNTLAHEHGHGLGIWHVCPLDQSKLMEAFLTTAFDGPQQDDVLAGNRGYGDFAEKPDQNDTAGSATFLGSLGGEGAVSLTGLSVDGLSDLDLYGFAAGAGALATVTATPTGTLYLSGPQTSECTGSPFDALRQSDLALELVGVDGASVLAFADSGGLGVAEVVTDVPLPTTGTYFVRVTGDVDRAQMYRLDVSLAPPAEADLAIAVTASDDPSPRGASLWYEVTVSNGGPGLATGVVVSESLPNGVTFVETVGCVEDPAGVASCGLGSLPAGGEVSYTVRVTVDANGPTSLTNTVTVTSTSPDPEAANDAAQVSTQAVELDCTAGAGATLALDAADNGTAQTFLAEGTIRAGSGFEVGGAESVTFVAGARVVLASGFAVRSGGSFEARIDDLLACP